MTRFASPDVLVNLHARLGEGPRWDHRKELLVWVDILGGHVHLTDPESGVTTTIPVGPNVGAIALRGDDDYLLAIRRGFATLTGSDLGEIREVLDDGVRMNDARVDPAGRFVAGSMALDSSTGLGSVYVLDTDGAVRTLIEGVTISNGLAWSADAARMFYVDSRLQGVDVMDYDLESGTIANRRRWADIPDADGTPDGIAIDSEGCLWVALWGGGKVSRYSPDGRLVGEIKLPVPQVTACEFGGPNLDRLFITTAAVGRPDGDPASALDGAVFVVEAGVVGTASAVAGVPS